MVVCPYTNRDPRRRPDLVGDYRVKCQVCALTQTDVIDVDARPGHVVVELQFGPMGMDGHVREDMVTEYAVYMVHPETGQRILPDGTGGDSLFTIDGAVTWVPSRAVPQPTVLQSQDLNATDPDASGSYALAELCCRDDAYIVRVVSALPAGLYGVRFEVVPVVENLGPMPSGLVTAVVQDAGHYLGATSSQARPRADLAMAVLRTAVVSFAALLVAARPSFCEGGPALS